MRRTPHRNIGFGMVGILLVAAAILLVGLLAWRFYDAGTGKQASSSQSSISSRPTNQTTTSVPADTTKYLDIKELKVKIKLEDGVKDATYTVQTLSDGSLVARFSTQSLAAIDSACDAKSGQLGALEKSTTDTDRLGNKLIPDGQSVFKFGSYYFTYVASQALCSAKAQSLVDAAVTAFHESLTTLQPDQ